MLVDPNRLYLGSETYNDDATIKFVDADFDVRTDKKEIDPESDFDDLWTIDATADALTLRDETTGTDLLKLTHDAIQLGDTLDLAGPLEDVVIGDGEMRLSGFNNVFEFRRSESDWDQMLEFHRQDNSDYELYLHRGGAPREIVTRDHDIDAATLDGNAPDDFLLGGFTARDNSEVVHDSVYEINFGTDLDVSATQDAVTVEFGGTSVPSTVYEDGAQVIAEADGINVKNGLNATSNNGMADIDVEFPSDMAQTGADEQVAGQWTFDQLILGTAEEADYAAEAGYAQSIDNAIIADFADRTVAETIGPNWTFSGGLTVPTGEEIGLGDGDAFRLRHSGNSDDAVLETDVGGSTSEIARIDRSDETIDVGFGLQQNGTPVATQTWVENDADVMRVDEENTYTVTQHFDGGVDASNGDYIAFPVHDSAPDHSSWPDGSAWFRSDLVN